jgi:SAM-dependent methyltransferase
MACGRAGRYHGRSGPVFLKRQGVGMFRWPRWHLAKMRLAFTSVAHPPRHVKVRYRRHGANAEDFAPNADPYSRMAALYNEYARWFVPLYGRFLAAAGRHYAVPIRAVLDLACGTGLVSRQVASRAEAVVGLDISEEMLRQARSLTPGSNVRYVRGDCRDFSLDETFEAAICGTDALNYLTRPGELAAVFRCVGRHLRPGGLFAFDVFDCRFFRRVAGRKAVVELNGQRWEWYNFYAPRGGVSETRVVLGGVVERHGRIPIEPEDVCRAAGAAGLQVAEHFSARTYLFLFPPYYPLYSFPMRQFYLLRRPET